MRTCAIIVSTVLANYAALTRPSASVKLASNRTMSTRGSLTTPPCMPECRSGWSLLTCRENAVSFRPAKRRKTPVAFTHGQSSMYNTAQAERQARHVLANPVRVGHENDIDVANEMLSAKRTYSARHSDTKRSTARAHSLCYFESHPEIPRCQSLPHPRRP